MNIQNNKRKRESVTKMETVFMNLLQTKNISEISVSDICKRAGLNRTTFYANYSDIYGLADSIRDKLELSLSDLYQEEIKTGINSNNYLKLFQHIKANQSLYKTYFMIFQDHLSRIVDSEFCRGKLYQNLVAVLIFLHHSFDSLQRPNCSRQAMDHILGAMVM